MTVPNYAKADGNYTKHVIANLRKSEAAKIKYHIIKSLNLRLHYSSHLAISMT